MDTTFLAFAINDLLGPLLMIGPLKVVFIAWVGLVWAEKMMKDQAEEPAPEMPEKG